VEIRKATESVTPLLKRSIKKDHPNTTTPNWRINHKHFARKRKSRLLEPGVVTFSSGWFGQGHEVRSFYYYFQYEY
jgi:hypothetical protein